MSLKMILVAALALVMVSCGGTGGGGSAAQKKSASTSFRAISALGPSIFSSVSLLKRNPRLLQAPETVALTCDSGAGTVTVDSTETSFSLVLKAPGVGCTESGTTISTPAAGLSMTFTGSGDYETSNYSFTLGINGSATITTGSSTETFSYGNFSIKFDVATTAASTNVTITVNGSVTGTTDGTQTFNNVVYNSNDLN